MASRSVKLYGKLHWAKVFEENRDMKGFEGVYEDCNGACTIDVLMDQDNFDKLRSSGSMKGKNAQPDEDGLYKVKFVRKFQETYGGGAPTVKHIDGRVWDLDEDGLIGNNSDGYVVLKVYDTSRKNIVGTRLEKVIVENNVGYEPPSDEDDAKPAAPKQNLDDDIPF